VSEQGKELSLWMNGKEQPLEHSLKMQDGHVMISLREIFEMLGAKVSWNAEQYQVVAEKGDKKVTLQIGSKEATVNGVVTMFETAPVLIDNVTYVPIRYVSEAYGSQVEWDEASRSVRITDSN
jgi:hypothetical protein